MFREPTTSNWSHSQRRFILVRDDSGDDDSGDDDAEDNESDNGNSCNGNSSALSSFSLFAVLDTDKMGNSALGYDKVFGEAATRLRNTYWW